jgi:hypothetical protein
MGCQLALELNGTRPTAHDFENDRTVGSSRWLVFVGSLDDTSGEVQGPANTRESLHFQGY